MDAWGEAYINQQRSKYGNTFFCITLTLYMLLLLSKPTYAFEISDNMIDAKAQSLINHTLILHDPKNNLTATDALKRLSHPKYVSNQLQSSGAQYWFYTPLINRSNHTRWALQSYNILFDPLDFYWHCEGQPLQKIPQPSLGLESLTLATTYTISLSIPIDAPCGVLQHARSPAFYPIKAYLMSQSEATKWSNLETTLSLICAGIIIGLIVYNLLLCISLRSFTYLIYTLYATVHLALMALLTWRPEILMLPGWEPGHSFRILSASVMVLFILFTLKFMQPGIEAAQNNPAKRKIFKVCSVLYSASLIPLTLMSLFVLETLIFPDNIGNSATIFPPTYILCSLYIPILSLAVTISGYKPAWVFLPAWSILVISHIVGTLDIIGVVNLTGSVRIQAFFSAAIEMMLLSIALGMNLRESLLKKDRALMVSKNAELLVEKQEKFVSTLSHEIRTPLHAMLGATTLLGRTDLSHKQQHYWSTTHYAAESMHALIDNLLDRTQVKNAGTSDKNTEFDPQRLLEAMIQLLKPRAEEKKLEVYLATSDLPDRLVGKPVILRRTLINLISNSIKYTDIGNISVTAKWISSKQELFISVEDTGQGISAEQLNHVEESFNVGVEALYIQNSSTGLGLPICFEMIKSEGGRLSLESSIGKGTKATFNLKMSLPTTPCDQPRIDNPNQIMKVLIVDDVASNRMIATELLTAIGHTVSNANNGEQASILAQQETFNVVISDMQMPKMDGIELLKALRKKYTKEQVSIIITSAHFDQKQCERLLSLGANACLPKPFTPSELISTLDMITTSQNNSKPENTLENLKNSLGDQKTAAILSLYIDQLNEDIERISTALKHHNHQAIRIAAHRIVSASKALGLKSNAEAATNIEIYEEAQKSIDWNSYAACIKQNLATMTFPEKDHG